MITPKRPLPSGSVVRHYDELDAYYREIWGEHVHHGLWRSGTETPEQAVRQLSKYVAELAGIRPNDAVCDIGSGYGASARLLAKCFGAHVTAVTAAPKQHAFALALDAGSGNPRYLLRDWQDNGLASESFDAAIAIESIEHMADKQRALAEAARVLRPAGRLVLCAWLAGEMPRGWQVHYLLEPVCRDGRIPGLATKTEFRALLEQAGFYVESFQDLSRQVRRTWSICVARLLRAICRDSRYRRYLLNPRNDNRVFVLTMIRMLMAYGTGAMRYGIFAARRLR
ncbi:MAG: SAM-dependent methyltransferase [Acidiferrobacterales bacterium]